VAQALSRATRLTKSWNCLLIKNRALRGPRASHRETDPAPLLAALDLPCDAVYNRDKLRGAHGASNQDGGRRNGGRMVRLHKRLGVFQVESMTPPAEGGTVETRTLVRR